MATPGSLIEYLQQKRVVCAFIVKHDKKGNLLVRTEDNRQDRVGRNKVLFQNTTKLDPEGPPEPMIELLKETSEKREKLAGDLELGELWELLAADPDEAWPLEDLSGFLYGDDEVDTEAMSALYRALHNDSIYFLRRGDEYKPRPAEQVEEIKTRIQVEAQRAEERQVVAAWILDIWKGGRREHPPELPAGFEEAAERYVQQIKDLALFGNDAPRAKDTLRLLKELEITRRDAPFRWLVKAAIWDEHENLRLHEYRTPIEFSAEVEEAARQAVERLPEVLAQEGRRSMEEAFTVTIDDAFTTEVDDALSLQSLGDGRWQIGIHIAEASAFVEPEDVLDREARVRGTSVYLPSRKIRMLPDILGDVVCSLTEGERRPAFSFVFEVDAELNIEATWMGPSAICVDRRLTYDQADAELEQEPEWSVLLRFAEKCRQQRRDQGAITVPFPRSQVRVEDGVVTVELENPHSASQVLVSEMMILANRTAANYFVENSVPAMFRFQQPPEKEIPNDSDFDPVTLYGLRRLFRKGETGYAPARHSGLGLDAYTQVTSPIRRYGDLLMQRQLKSSLAQGEPLYDQESLKERCLTLSQSTSQAEGMERHRKYYWTLVYLEQRRHQEMRAIVLANQGDKNWVQLADVLMETDCAAPAKPLPAGSEFLVRIEQVFPRDRTLRVSPSVEED